MTRIVPGTSRNGIVQAVALLRTGGVVGLPTETVYGLGTDARNGEGIGRIYAVKSRPGGNPLIVHVKDVVAARRAARDWPAAAEKLAEKFWPGPLTVIVGRGAEISPAVSAGRETVALRVPSHRVAQALLAQFGGPIAAPSANRSGFTSPTTAQHVLAELDGRIELILDGGPCQVGLESTVVDLTTAVPTILRPGAVTEAMIEGVIGRVEVRQAVVSEAEAAASPGQHARHYAPRTPAYRFVGRDWEGEGSEVKAFVEKMAREGGKVVLLTHDAAVRLGLPHEVILLSDSAERYGRNLYSCLRQADELEGACILVLMPESGEGLWPAIVDRLNRATQTLPAV